MSDLHVGRVDPRRFPHNFTGQRRFDFDASAYLREALTKQRLLEAVKEVEPQMPLYGQLRQALRRESRARLDI